MRQHVNIIGKKFNHLLVVEEILPREGAGKKTYFKCICECGTETITRKDALTTGSIKSCGCLQKKSVTTHMYSLIHNIRPEYRAWAAMKTRCYNKKERSYKDYGGRGIKVCDRWLNSFENFLADMGNKPTPKHSIDRKDTNKGYSPENCRWATKKEQANNKRTTMFITIDGQTKSVSEWAETLGIKRDTLYKRHKRKKL